MDSQIFFSDDLNILCPILHLILVFELTFIYLYLFLMYSFPLTDFSIVLEVAREIMEESEIKSI